MVDNGTLQQLKRRRDLLRARDQSRKDFRKIQIERSKLKKEIRELRNPSTTAFKKNLKKGIIIGGRSTLNYLDNLTRPVPVRRGQQKKPVRKAPTKKKRRKR